MNVRRGGLGRGLGALIPAGPVDDDVAGARFAELPIDSSIEPNPRQPREDFDEEALAELVTSIREVGVLQPVVVREISPGRYQLVMGERRWRACREAGLATDPGDHPRHRRRRAAARCAAGEPAPSAAQPARRGCGLPAAAGRVRGDPRRARRPDRPVPLPGVATRSGCWACRPTVQRRVAAGVLSAGHARALLALARRRAQERLAARIVAEGLSVRATEELVRDRRGARRPSAARAPRAPKAPGAGRPRGVAVGPARDAR